MDIANLKGFFIWMTRILTTLALFVAFAGMSYAQQVQRSIEITTGYPSILHFFEFPNTSVSIDRYEHGIRETEHYQPELNIGYTYQWRERWEVNTMINLHLTILDVYKYPLLPEYEDVEEPFRDANHYDWDAEPSASKRINLYGASCTAIRFKWLVRDGFCMYSGLGAGISLGFPIIVPYLAPIGIKFGKGKVYGIVEANVSAATTFGMAGIAIKL